MSKARYIIAILVFVAVLVTGVVLACVYETDLETQITFSVLAYGVGAFLANLIWFDGIVVKVAVFGFGLCGSLIAWFVGLLGSWLGWIILILLGMFIASALATIITVTITVIFVLACVMFPINLIRYGFDLY